MSFTFCLFSFISYSQDSIPTHNSAEEINNLKFQEYFFKALSEKAIYNYQKAIENLEECNRLIPNDKAVLFELSKNFLKLNRTYESLQYANDALKKDTKNLWILEHIVNIYKRDRNFNEAIKTQERIGELFPKKRKSLVYLHLQNNDVVSAKEVLKELQEAKLLDARLRRIQEKLTSPPKITSLVTSKKSIVKKVTGDLKTEFTNNKTFSTLSTLLTKLYTENDADLLRFSEEGMQLFPAQPIVYLMNGRALIQQKKYKKAIVSLQTGIDFVIDNNEMQSNFYKELIKAYERVGDAKNRKKFQKKLNAL
ncbi:tetratricopeptide repeat protein [Tenacibaculum holothuriorum]|uniref:tetratricopeptide repeat protein n=1 Tax=Tenacibaculum holothuriorum TaxID=1635173 RepID=UPI000A31F215|nr:hypothetical protein [Tenacibaculum holothuriorum]